MCIRDSVKVVDTGTLIWEGSCGSGTIACAVAASTGLADGLFEQDYFQPAGVVRALSLIHIWQAKPT